MKVFSSEVFRDLVIPLLTILASGVVASVVTFRLNAGLQRRDLLRTKLEEAYAGRRSVRVLRILLEAVR